MIKFLIQKAKFIDYDLCVFRSLTLLTEEQVCNLVSFPNFSFQLFLSNFVFQLFSYGKTRKIKDCSVISFFTVKRCIIWNQSKYPGNKTKWYHFSWVKSFFIGPSPDKLAQASERSFLTGHAWTSSWKVLLFWFSHLL